MVETALVIGGAGYIGSALVARLLRDTKSNVCVLDSLLYGGESLLPFFNFKERFRFVRGDMRSIEVEQLLKNVDYVINLAALVGEPICRKYPKEAREINLDANLRLARECEKNGVRRYIFSSTCSNYGLSEDDRMIDENGKLQPISLYAETKVQSELRLLNDHKKMHVTVLRFATAYGLASRVRFDLLLHEFIRDAWTKKKVTVYGPDSWRPMVHVDDIARAVIMSLEVVSDSNDVYNVGGNEQNYKKGELATMVAKRFDCNIETLQSVKDPRSYRVSFDKIRQKFGFIPNFTPEYSINQIAEALESGIITDRILSESVNIKPE